LHKLNHDVGASAVLAPALVYEAGRPDIVELNAKLFSVAKSVEDYLGLPTWATLVLGTSVTTADQTIDAIVSDATALTAAGWYFAFEFSESGIPCAHSSILRFCNAGLILGCTGKPVLHAFSGPLGLLSPCFGATAIGVGHSQNLWQFTRERWQPSDGGGGGGGDAPPRFFFFRPPYGARSSTRTNSPSCPTSCVRQSSRQVHSLRPSRLPPYIKWDRWEANKTLGLLLAKHAEASLNQQDAEKSVSRGC